MSPGTIKRLVHLSQQTHLLNAGLVSGHNEHGYGVLADEQGREVYFSHEAVAGRCGFDDLRQGQQVEFTLESGNDLRAIRVGAPAAAPLPGPAA